MVKCQIVKSCGLRRRICRKANGQIKSSTVIGGGKKTKGRRKSRKAKRSARKQKKQRVLAKNIHCVKTRVRGKCRQVCTRKRRGKSPVMISNDPAKNCGRRAIVLQ